MTSSTDYKISLPTAILINVNIMLGAGIFINTSTLAQRSGSLGAAMYLLVGVLMLPLILSIAQLLKMHPEGGFYIFAKKEIHPFAGFLSGWCYFTAKLSSCTLMIHVSITLLQRIIPFLNQIHPFILDAGVILTFSLLNLLNIKSGSSIQKVFVGLKTFPIFFAIIAGLYLLNGNQHFSSPLAWESTPSSLPLVLYAIIGFEAACSISGKIKNSSKNGPIAILASFGIVILIATIYQAIFYWSLGEQLIQCKGHCDIFPALLVAAFGNSQLAGLFEIFLHIAIASSTLGAAYGVLFSNVWNLHILAQNNHIIGSKRLGQLNRNAIPYFCVAIEAAICLTYLFISQGVSIPLQQIGSLGCVIAYSISILALLKALAHGKATDFPSWIPWLGLASCSLLVTACVKCFFEDGMSSLAIYSLFLFAGIFMFISTQKKKTLISHEL